MDLFPLNHVLELDFGHIWEQLISPVLEVDVLRSFYAQRILGRIFSLFISLEIPECNHLSMLHMSRRVGSEELQDCFMLVRDKTRFKTHDYLDLLCHEDFLSIRDTEC